VRTHNDDKGAQEHQLCVLPPHTPTDGSRSLGTRQNSAARHASTHLSESPRLSGQVVGLVDQKIEPFASREDLLDVLDHDVLGRFDLMLGFPKGVPRWRLLVPSLVSRYDENKRRFQRTISWAIRVENSFMPKGGAS
jgi:hypothetical protein